MSCFSIFEPQSLKLVLHGMFHDLLSWKTQPSSCKTNTYPDSTDHPITFLELQESIADIWMSTHHIAWGFSDQIWSNALHMGTVESSTPRCKQNWCNSKMFKWRARLKIYAWHLHDYLFLAEVYQKEGLRGCTFPTNHMAALLKKKGSSDSIVPSIQKGFSVELQKHQCFFAQKRRSGEEGQPISRRIEKTLEVTKCCRITMFVLLPVFGTKGHWREICHTNDHTFRYKLLYCIVCKVWLINHLGSLKTTHGECPELCWLKACGDFATKIYEKLIPASRSDGSSNCQMWTNQSKLIQRLRTIQT